MQLHIVHIQLQRHRGDRNITVHLIFNFFFYIFLEIFDDLCLFVCITYRKSKSDSYFFVPLSPPAAALLDRQVYVADTSKR